MAVSRRLRFEVLKRDNYTCRYCGGKSPDVELRVDHVIPSALGGSDDPSNLVAACQPCNGGKSSVNPDAPLVAEVSEDAWRWSRAMELASGYRAKQMGAVDAACDEIAEVWSRYFSGATIPSLSNGQVRRGGIR